MSTSYCWKYFDVHPKDNSKCIFKICKATISTGGKSEKSYTTTNMLNHIKKFIQMRQKLKRQYDWSQPSTSEASCSNYESPKKVQPTIQSVLVKSKIWDINDHKFQEIHYLIGDMIAVDIQPYSLASDIGFQRLIAKLCPNYRIPSRKYFIDKIILDVFMKVKAKIQISLDEISSLSLTTDIWTASINNAPFFSVTGHWLSDEFEQCRAVLRVVPFPGSHTSEIISEQLHIVLNEYKISNKIFLVLRVSAANMVGGMRKCGVQSLSCFIRTLQLSVNDSIFSQKAVSNIIANSRKIVSHFNHSPLATSKLTEIQEQLKLDKHKLIQDVP